MFYDFLFEVQVYFCFLELYVEFIGSISEGFLISEVIEGNENEEFDFIVILQMIIVMEVKNFDENIMWLEIQYCVGNFGFVLLKVYMKDNSEYWCGLSNIVFN